MTIGELKQLINDKPDQFTNEQWDDITVVMMTGEDTFESPCPGESGLIDVEQAFDQDGNPLDLGEDMYALALLPHDFENDVDEDAELN